MIWDINLFGLYINMGLATAALAGLATLLLRKLLALGGAYGRVWHPALFDLSLFVLIWCGMAAASRYVLPSLSLMLG